MSCNGPGALIRSPGSSGGSKWAEAALDGRRHIQVPAPLLDQDLRLAERVEHLGPQQLVAQLAVEALDVAVTGHGDPGARVSRHSGVAVYGATVDVGGRLEGPDLGANEPVASG